MLLTLKIVYLHVTHVSDPWYSTDHAYGNFSEKRLIPMATCNNHN